ncbi:MAG: hypothetical protein LBJ48_07345 [Coriobacteriales bacterium]|jgi:hypothetical protein|nr:hypothetical protein [Coriobacteriales bacterium]
MTKNNKAAPSGIKAAILKSPYNNWILALCFAGFQKALGRLPKVARIAKYLFQIAGIGILVFGVLQIMAFSGLQGAEGFVKNVFAGLTFQTESSAFYNGVVAALPVLLAIYGGLCALSFNKAVYVMDAAVLYLLAFSMFPIYQFPLIINGSIYIAIWLIHRLLLGSICVFYKKSVKLAYSTGKTESIGKEVATHV